jgi:hypothetical protein
MANHPNRPPAPPAKYATAAQARSAREAAGHTQGEAAGVVNYDQAAWSFWEAGRRRMPSAVWRCYMYETGQLSPPERNRMAACPVCGHRAPESSLVDGEACPQCLHPLVPPPATP